MITSDLLIESNKIIQGYKLGFRSDGKCMWCINFTSFHGADWKCGIGFFRVSSVGTCKLFDGKYNRKI